MPSYGYSPAKLHKGDAKLVGGKCPECGSTEICDQSYEHPALGWKTIFDCARCGARDDDAKYGGSVFSPIYNGVRA